MKFQETAMYNLIRMLGNIDELEHVAATLNSILNILPSVLLQTGNTCLSFPPLHRPRCILTNESYATLEGGILNLNKTSVESVKLGKASDLSENLSWKFSTPF